jgi:hypothetical protein
MAFDLLYPTDIYFSLSVLLKGLYVEQNKWEYTKGDRQYQIFGTFVS